MGGSFVPSSNQAIDPDLLHMNVNTAQAPTESLKDRAPRLSV